jgi:hypothetical protein
MIVMTPRNLCSAGIVTSHHYVTSMYMHAHTRAQREVLEQWGDTGDSGDRSDVPKCNGVQNGPHSFLQRTNCRALAEACDQPPPRLQATAVNAAEHCRRRTNSLGPRPVNLVSDQSITVSRTVRESAYAHTVPTRSQRAHKKSHFLVLSANRPYDQKSREGVFRRSEATDRKNGCAGAREAKRLGLREMCSRIEPRKTRVGRGWQEESAPRTQSNSDLNFAALPRKSRQQGQR